jgi:hypothetical protein
MVISAVSCSAAGADIFRIESLISNAEDRLKLKMISIGSDIQITAIL